MPIGLRRGVSREDFLQVRTVSGRHDCLANRQIQIIAADPAYWFSLALRSEVIYQK